MCPELQIPNGDSCRRAPGSSDSSGSDVKNYIATLVQQWHPSSTATQRLTVDLGENRFVEDVVNFVFNRRAQSKYKYLVQQILIALCRSTLGASIVVGGEPRS